MELARRERNGGGNRGNVIGGDVAFLSIWCCGVVVVHMYPFLVAVVGSDFVHVGMQRQNFVPNVVAFWTVVHYAMMCSSLLLLNWTPSATVWILCSFIAYCRVSLNKITLVHPNRLLIV